MGPTCVVNLTSLNDSVLAQIHDQLKHLSDDLSPTRKGRVWDTRIQGRPFHVCVEEDIDGSRICLSAGCNQDEDWKIIENVSIFLANSLGGKSTRPEK